MRKIVIAGCGFAGYHAARLLEKSLAGRRRVEVTVVTARAHFVFSRLLSKVASGELSPEHIVTPVDEALSTRTRVVVDEITGVDLDRRRLITEREPLSFDYLLIATGSQRRPSAFQGAELLLGPDSLSEAVAIRDHIAELRPRDDAPLSFAIIGASSSGVEWSAELASALAEDRDLRSATGDLSIDLFEAGPRILPDHSAQMSAHAVEVLNQLGVQIHTDTLVESARNDQLTVVDGEPRTFSRVFHCAGRAGLPLWSKAGVDVDELGRIIVEDTLALAAHPAVFVAGDAAAPVSDTPLRSDPQIALQQGQWAARNLLAAMSGRTLKPFQFEASGDFLTLGRHQAALELRGVLLEGRAAWLANRLYYTALMPRALKKARLLVDWIARRIGSDDTASGQDSPRRLSSDSD